MRGEKRNSGAGEQSGVANLNEFINSNTWLNDLEILINRHASLGINSDVAGMSMVELYGLYLFLRGLA